MKIFLGFSSQIAQLICSFLYLLLVRAVGCMDYKFRHPKIMQSYCHFTLLCTIGTQSYCNKTLCVWLQERLYFLIHSVITLNFSSTLLLHNLYLFLIHSPYLSYFPLRYSYFLLPPVQKHLSLWHCLQYRGIVVFFYFKLHQNIILKH